MLVLAGQKKKIKVNQDNKLWESRSSTEEVGLPDKFIEQLILRYRGNRSKEV